MGSYCQEGVSLPVFCPAGSYQDKPGQTFCDDCPPGYYCLGNSTDYISTECPTGSYCLVNTTRPSEYQCWPGTYNQFTKQTNSSACLPCSGGMYCPGYGNIMPYANCSGGYYCPSGAMNATAIICPIGHFCPNGSIEATPCTKGHYCDRQGLIKPTFKCKEGFYCTLRASQYNPTDNITGNECPKGNYCPLGSSSPSLCPVGTFLNTTRNV